MSGQPSRGGQQSRWHCNLFAGLRGGGDASDAPPTQTYLPGTAVRIHGLVGRPELNGTQGVVVSAFEAAKGRCGEAMSAASAVSGMSVSLPGARTSEPDTPVGRLCRHCPALSLRQRIAGAGVCLLLGARLSLGSSPAVDCVGSSPWRTPVCD